MGQVSIVVLDGFTLNPGDLSWSRLEQLGRLAIYERTPPHLVASRAAAAEVVLTNKARLPAETLAQLPRLEYVGVTATGTNVVDVSAARARGIVVTNVPAYGTASVAQLVFAHILHFSQDVAGHADSVRHGDWSRAADWCYWNRPLVELDGLTLGIIGYGRIGRATAAIGRAFGMRILATRRSPAEHETDVEFVSCDTLLAQSDVVSLHCPLTDETWHLMNQARLKLMKPTALLVNTARGALVDSRALAAALAAGRIGGAALDVLEAEPPPHDDPLLTAPRCAITPHLAWATRAARGRLIEAAIDNVQAWLDGEPQNVVEG